MTKWIADYEVESHLSLVKNDLKLKYKDPNDLYEVHVKNLNVKPPVEKPLLSVQIIIECDAIDSVAEKSKEYLKLFLNVLSFVTNTKFSIHCLDQIIDWTSGLDMRDCHQFLTSPDPGIPMPVLDDGILKSVNILMRRDIPNDLRRALRWFSRGVGADYLDEQFQYFWFSLETLSEQDKSPTKVADQCPKCNGPLYCKTCKETPMHRPYPKQAIEQLIKKVVRGDPEKLYNMLTEVRHALLHGDDTDEIEKSLPVDMSQLVDNLGQTVWAALINSFKVPPGTSSLMFLKTNTYSHRKLVTKTVMGVGSGSNKDKPQIEEVPKLKVEMYIHEEQDKKNG